MSANNLEIKVDPMVYPNGVRTERLPRLTRTEALILQEAVSRVLSEIEIASLDKRGAKEAEAQDLFRLLRL